jgi:hypothetical protein
MFNRAAIERKNSLALKENPIFAEIEFTVTVPVTCETKAAPPPGRWRGCACWASRHTMLDGPWQPE